MEITAEFGFCNVMKYSSMICWLVDRLKLLGKNELGLRSEESASKFSVKFSVEDTKIAQHLQNKVTLGFPHFMYDR